MADDALFDLILFQVVDFDGSSFDFFIATNNEFCVVSTDIEREDFCFIEVGLSAGGFVTQVKFFDISSLLDVKQLAILSECGMEQESVVSKELRISNGPGDSTAKDDFGEFGFVFIIDVEERGSALSSSQDLATIFGELAIVSSAAKAFIAVCQLEKLGKSKKCCTVLGTAVS